MASVRKILVVDDNADAADLAAEYLRAFGGDVSVAYGGIDAVAAARAAVPNVIFLDIGMPGMDGYQVARTLRADATFGDVKIVALTAWGDSDSREMAKMAGFDFHITKPANLETLLTLSSLPTSKPAQ